MGVIFDCRGHVYCFTTAFSQIPLIVSVTMLPEWTGSYNKKTKPFPHLAGLISTDKRASMFNSPNTTEFSHAMTKEVTGVLFYLRDHCRQHQHDQSTTPGFVSRCESATQRKCTIDVHTSKLQLHRENVGRRLLVFVSSRRTMCHVSCLHNHLFQEKLRIWGKPKRRT